MDPDRTDFGFESVTPRDKQRRVGAVFDSVAESYDRMNDLMSLGLHRWWKAFAVERCAVRPGDRVLDIAAGSGDLSIRLAARAGEGSVVMTDINRAMLERGRDRALDRGVVLPAVQCNAEALPFSGDCFDCVCVAFGLRNMAAKERALGEMRRVLRPGGRLLILEFSRIWAPLSGLYDRYSFSVLPWLGERVAGDRDSYRYLAESIRMHPDQEALKAMMERCGLEDVCYWNLSAGVVAVHRGYKYA